MYIYIYIFFMARAEKELKGFTSGCRPLIQKEGSSNRMNFPSGKQFSFSRHQHIRSDTSETRTTKKKKEQQNLTQNNGQREEGQKRRGEIEAPTRMHFCALTLAIFIVLLWPHTYTSLQFTLPLPRIIRASTYLSQPSAHLAATR